MPIGRNSEGRWIGPPANPAPLPKEHKETDWEQIKQQVQMRELPDEQIPKLLFRAVQKIEELQEQLRSLKQQIGKLYDYSEVERD